MDVIPFNDHDTMGFGSMNRAARDINRNAHDKGFYDNPRSFGEAVALIHSEVSEALEEDRAGSPGLWFQRSDGETFDPSGVYIDQTTGLVYDRPDGPETGDHPLKPEGRDVELIDAVIRVFDTLYEGQANLDLLLVLKHAYNLSREPMHGKRY